MKRLILALAAVLLAAAFAVPGFCLEDTAQPAGKVLVAYFSRTENTRPLAEAAAAYYGADLFEITAKVPYSDEDINYHDKKSRSSVEQNDPGARPELAAMPGDLSEYDTVVLAYPIWWGQAPRIICTFVESADLAGKTIVPFCTSASSGIGSSAENLAKLSDPSAVWVKGQRFAAGTSNDVLTRRLGSVCPAGSREEAPLRLFVDGTEAPVEWAENAAVAFLKEEAAKAPVVCELSEYGGFEQSGSLGKKYPSEDTRTTAQPGDIMLYNSSTLVLFYGTNTWEYTPLGRCTLPADEWSGLLRAENVTVEITY